MRRKTIVENKPFKINGVTEWLKIKYSLTEVFNLLFKFKLSNIHIDAETDSFLVENSEEFIFDLIEDLYDVNIDTLDKKERFKAFLKNLEY